MSVPTDLETEEDLLTCLHIKFYHPKQHMMSLFMHLDFGRRIRHSADDPLRLGRDAKTCTFSLNDMKVSRKQLSLYAYRTPQSPHMLFTIQNLSERAKLSVNGSTLDFLERMDLPEKALVKFGEYEILIIQEPKEAKASFEVELEVLTAPPSQETCICVPSNGPVMETGSNGVGTLTAEPTALGPMESDESLDFQ